MPGDPHSVQLRNATTTYDHGSETSIHSHYTKGHKIIQPAGWGGPGIGSAWGGVKLNLQV